ncbi:MAG: hypothetical protein K2Y37_17915 [Pirellulales bacterium]|nr:hypothetical protein [Pirellulales bacterium]
MTQRRSCRQFLLGLMATIVVGCSPAHLPLEQPTAAYFTANVLRLEFAEPVTLDGVSILSADRAPIARLATAGSRRSFELPFRWQPRMNYRLEIESGQQRVELKVPSPQVQTALSARLEAPPGQDAAHFGQATSLGVLATSGSVELAVIVESNQQVAAHYDVTFAPDKHVTLTPSDASTVADESTSVVRFSGDFDRQFEYRTLTVSALLVEGAVSGEVAVTFQQRLRGDQTDNVGSAERLKVVLRRATAAEFAGRVTCDRVIFPANRLGQPQLERLSGAMVLPNPVWSAIRNWFWPSRPAVDLHGPYGHEAIYLTNHTDVALNLVVESDVRDVATGEALLAFAPPAFKAPVESATSVHVLRLRGGETAPAIVPIYARADVVPGHYERRIEVSLLGETKPLLARELPLEVRRGDPLVSSVAIASLVISAIVWWTLAVAARPIVRGVGVEGLTTIALIAGLYFAVSYASRLAGDALAAITGPFYVFIAGVGNEGLTSLLWATLVVLLPRVGTIFLASLVVFLLQAVFTGQFGIVDLLFVSVSIALAEAALAIAGVTTASGFANPRTAPTGSQVLRVAGALGCANAATLFAQYCLIEVLHRLYFATWYVASVSLVTGFVYGAVGAAIGTRFGFRLRRTAR